MRKVPLGRTGIQVSEFFFGAGSIGGVGTSTATRAFGLTHDQGLERLDEAVELGVTVIDTADAYGGGQSEQTVGQWFADRSPDGVLVSTKVGLISRPDGSRDVSLSSEHIERQLHQSIERLGHVDLYLSHAPDAKTPMEETLAAFTAAQEAGRIRAFGASNITAPLLEQLLDTADRTGLQGPQWVQNRMNLLDRRDEGELLDLVTREGLGYTPFSPLAGGVLSDRYLDGAEAEPGSRIAVAGNLYYKGFHTPENLEKVAALRDIARERSVSVSALALAWLRDHPAVTAPIVSPSKPAQWDAVREAVATRLTEDEHARISAIFD
jgi:aryl-alcohol dehydrogenase-like predicted oxidoreductase